MRPAKNPVCPESTRRRGLMPAIPPPVIRAGGRFTSIGSSRSTLRRPASSMSDGGTATTRSENVPSPMSMIFRRKLPKTRANLSAMAEFLF
ncbi:hypothetical protein D3C86_1896970 [compost metagenome]